MLVGTLDGSRSRSLTCLGVCLAPVFAFSKLTHFGALANVRWQDIPGVDEADTVAASPARKERKTEGKGEGSGSKDTPKGGTAASVTKSAGGCQDEDVSMTKPRGHWDMIEELIEVIAWLAEGLDRDVRDLLATSQVRMFLMPEEHSKDQEEVQIVPRVDQVQIIPRVGQEGEGCT